ncbi:MAG: Rieske 2Fe-2S domain-containing protein [Alphaproteobacteria bacterium]
MNDIATMPQPVETASPDALLRGLWYFALPSRTLKAGRLVGKTLVGEPIVFARQAGGAVFALRDVCPHRGIPLRHGRMVGGEVECPYHGWRFGASGACSLIPSLVEGQPLDPSRIKVRRFPVVERAGCIWVYIGAAGEAPAIEPPRLPVPDDARPRMITRIRFPCHVDHAVIGLMDPAHGPFVHRSWWWRSSRSIHSKSKAFGPTERGFAMLRHAPSRNSAGYRILGGEISTEISFELPSIRIEHMEAGRNAVVGLTAVTPVSAEETELHQIFYWSNPLLTVLRPLLGVYARRFLDQDLGVVIKQQEGLAHNPSLMLIADADTQAKWYFRLKREWQTALLEGRPFRNPIEPATLRWRS